MSERPAIDCTCATPGCAAPRDRRLTARLLFLLPAFGSALALLGFQRVYRIAGRLSAAGLRRGARRRRGTRSPEHVAATIVHVNRHVLPYQSRCLLESLTLWFLLRRSGHGAELFLGARTLLGPFEAHAWVELDGIVLNDAANVRDVYEPFDLAEVRAGARSP